MSELNAALFHVWAAKAEEDNASARILLEYDGPAATVCFLCQQMAEKYLKAFALLQDRPLKRIHDLEVLLRDCIALDGSLEDLGGDAKLLTSYYMPSRYPDDLPEDVRPEQGVSAYEAATRIRVRILASVDRLSETSRG